MGTPLIVSKMKRTAQGGGYLPAASKMRRTAQRGGVPPHCVENRNNDTTRRCTHTPPCCVEKRTTALRGGGYLLAASLSFAFVVVLKREERRCVEVGTSSQRRCPSCLLLSLAPVLPFGGAMATTIRQEGPTSSPLLVVLSFWCSQYIKQK